MTNNVAHTNASLLASLPPGTTRVQVIDEFGRTKFKKPSDVMPVDQILCGTDGRPIVMSGSPGRKKKPDMRPANHNIAEMIRAKQIHLSEDGLLEAVRTNPETGAVLDYVMEGLAEESASLGFERHEAERTGQPTSQISMRRINALKAVGDSWLKRKEQLSSAGVDLDSKAFERVFAYIMETFKDTVVDVMPNVREELIETLFANFSKKVSDEQWAREAAKRMTDG